MDKPIIINLYAGPGTGKSMMMHGLMFELKMHGFNCEMSPEFAKDKVWEQSYQTLGNQMYIFGKQYHRLERISNKVDVVVTDSPLLFSLYYGKDESDEFKNLVIQKFNNYNNMNIFFERACDYDTNGRMQTEEEAKQIDEEILEIVKEHCVDYIIIPTGRESVLDIVKAIEQYGNT